MYIALEQGQTTLRGQYFDVNKNILSLRSFVTSFKKISLKSDFIHIFKMILYMCIYSPRAVNPLGTKFWCQQKGLITLPICCKFQKNLFEVWFYTYFNDFIHVYSSRAGADNPLGQNVDVNRKALSLCPFVESFKRISLKSDFIHIFSSFYTCI